MTKIPKILFYDIETSPNLGYIWAKYEQDVLEYEKEWDIISIAWTWGNDRKIQCMSQKTKTEEDICVKLWDLFDEADIIIAHNGDRFDQKKVNTKLLFHDYPPPSLYATVDTLKVAKKYFKFNSNRLDDLGNYLGVGRKVAHTGIKLWLNCLRRDRAAWNLMEKYNKQDVRLLRRVYNKMKPWIEKHPHIGLLKERSSISCNKCGSTNVIKQGTRITVTAKTKKRKYQCLSCGGWFSGKF